MVLALKLTKQCEEGLRVYYLLKKRATFILFDLRVGGELKCMPLGKNTKG